MRALRTVCLVLAASALLVHRAPAAPDAPNVQGTTGAGITKAIRSYPGKVVVVNLWATWCEPCVEEFPELVRLSDAYKGKDVVLLSVSLDEPEDRAKVVRFIQSQKAAFPVLMRTNGAEKVEQFISPLDKKWTGAVPTTYIFNRAGKPVGQPILGRRTYAQFEAALKPALK